MRMSDKLETKKFVFSVEGETEQWYLLWLRDQINQCEKRKYNVSIDAKIQQSPKKFYKTVNAKTTPEIIHICDVESNEPVHVEKFRNILSEMKEAKTQKRITYRLGYSNFTFELWIVLHKKDCNGMLTHRRQYLEHINRAFGESFENPDQYKHEDEFKGDRKNEKTYKSNNHDRISIFDNIMCFKIRFKLKNDPSRIWPAGIIAH